MINLENEINRFKSYSLNLLKNIKANILYYDKEPLKRVKHEGLI